MKIGNLLNDMQMKKQEEKDCVVFILAFLTCLWYCFKLPKKRYFSDILLSLFIFKERYLIFLTFVIY